MSQQERLISDLHVEQIYGIPRGTLRKWRIRGNVGPRWRKLGGPIGKRGAMVRYRVEDIEEWLRSCPSGGAQPVAGATA